MEFDNLKKEVVAKPAKIEATTEEQAKKAITAIITDNKEISELKPPKTSNLETFDQIKKKLTTKFMFGTVYLFLDLDINKYVIINYNSHDKFDNMKTFDKQAIGHLLKSMISTRIRDKEIEFFAFTKDIINGLINSVQGVKKSFDRSKKEFFTDTDYIPTLNLFKRTSLHDYEVINTISYETLEKSLNTNYKRLAILLKNNIGGAKEIQWFLNWVSLEINNPSSTKTTFIIIGEQGSGKTVLVEEMFKENIYHFSNVSVLDNKTIKDNFNDIYNYKSFIIMNEVSTMDMKENNQIAQDLKRLITDGSYINRGMFKSGVEKKKTFNLGFTTNKNVPVQIENGDRRFSVFGRGKKLLEMEEVINLNENFNSFIDNVKIEIKEFLYLIKALDYNKNVAIDPIMTDLKKKIIEQSNKKEDLMKSYFNTRNYDALEALLRGFDIDNEENFYTKLEKMFKVGIFTNDILFTIYITVYEIDINDYNSKSESKKSGAFWGKILHKPAKPQIKINGNPINFKVFEETDIEEKKHKLRDIVNGLTVVYEELEEDEEIPF